MNYFLTEDRLAELKTELSSLKTVKRIEISERLKRAKELGDLSENAEYLEAKDEQERVERRIDDLEGIVQNATIIKKNIDKTIIDIGSTVEVLRDGKTMKFFIVGSNEARPEEGRISNESPLGRELINKKVGDSVTVETPQAKKIQYKIFKIT
ncbi:MAG TPA: transcription elongation factor GreA [Candidatus Paceibacterota bacterium]